MPAPSHCTFQGTCVPVRGMYGCSKDCLILIPVRLPQITCFTLNLKCFSCDSDNCPDVGIRTLLQFPHPLRAGPVLLTLLFFSLVPLSYRVFCGCIHCLPPSAGVLHALLCLKVCSWCIHGERYTPHPHLLLHHLVLPFSPCYFLELCILMGISFLSSFAFSFSSYLSYL